MRFIAHDVIERRNTLRQKFTEHEVGCSKADALSFRLNTAFGLDIMAVPAPFSAERFDVWTAHCTRRAGANLTISAVDNHLARRQNAKVVESQKGRRYCLDLGNEQNADQVLLGGVTDPDDIRFDRLGLCTGLPSPFVQEPTLLEPSVDAGSLSSTELTLQEEQSLVVNQQIAAPAAHYAYQLLVRRELTQIATCFTLEPPMTQSQRMSQEGIRRFLQEFSSRLNTGNFPMVTPELHPPVSLIFRPGNLPTHERWFVRNLSTIAALTFFVGIYRYVL